MSDSKIKQHLTLSPDDTDRLSNLRGELDSNLRHIEARLGVDIYARGNYFQIIGLPKSILQASNLLEELYMQTESGTAVTEVDVNSLLQQVRQPNATQPNIPQHRTLTAGKNVISPRTPNQAYYIDAILRHDINFGIGPSGTGKTFLAVAAALHALDMGQCNRIILCRPAVEAGEQLGFLPGDLSEKISPYLQPLYDALFDMYGVNRVDQLVKKGVLEVASLAYMRGRTLSDSFVILDEAQNTTQQQMKMFLTRIGFGSKAVITGDITQTDLPRHQGSGLRHAIRLLQEIEGISFTFFKSNDIVRHALVQKIIHAYDHEQ